HFGDRTMVPDRIQTEDSHTSAVGFSQSGDVFDRRGLPGAVGAENPEDLTLVDLEAHPVHHGAVAVGLVQVVHFDGGHASTVRSGTRAAHRPAGCSDIIRSADTAPRRGCAYDCPPTVGFRTVSPVWHDEHRAYSRSTPTRAARGRVGVRRGRTPVEYNAIIELDVSVDDLTADGFSSFLDPIIRYQGCVEINAHGRVQLTITVDAVDAIHATRFEI